MKRNLDEHVKEIKKLNKQCSLYVEQIEKIKKDVRQNNLPSYHENYSKLF